MRIIAWMLAVMVAVAFLGAGSAKLTAQPMTVRMFADFGYPVWFMYFAGLLELVGVLLVLVPRLAGIGAALLAAIMLGAIVSHLAHGQAEMIVAPLGLLVIALALGTIRGWSRGVEMATA